MVATAQYSDNSQAIQNNGITWSSTNTDILGVDATGIINGIFQGSATLSARKGSVQTSIQVSVEEGPSIISVGPGLTVGSDGLACLTNGNQGDSYDTNCVRYSLDATNFGWTPDVTHITLATIFSEPIKSIRFTGYWRQSYNPLDSGGRLGSWSALGCDDADCASATVLNAGSPLSFNSIDSAIRFPGNTRAFPFYRVVFQNGPVNRNSGSGSGSFSEVIYGF